MKAIGRGAEAVLYKSGASLIKDRIKKGYRLPQIDERLRKLRTREESRLLERAKRAGVPTPSVLKKDDKKMFIEMEFIDGEIIRDILTKSNMKSICSKIGKQIRLLHKNEIIHGDLTTSNMILKNNELYFIDYGLGKMSKRIEDYASDLHLIEEALTSGHTEIADECFSIITDNYIKTFSKGKDVIQRLDIVRKRGRYVKRENEGNSTKV